MIIRVNNRRPWWDAVPEMHRSIFRGKNLGSTFTDEQKEAIAAGTWDDLYVGDYWVMNGHTWRIADFDYWLDRGNPTCMKRHIVVVPDARLYQAQMQNTESGNHEDSADTTEGGYYNSDMRQKNLTQDRELIDADFGVGAVLNHRIVLTNAAKDGYPTAFGWYDSEVELMNEMMVYGAFHFAARGNGIVVPNNTTTDYTQLALFQVAPLYINVARQSYWLRDIGMKKGFADVSNDGYSAVAGASYILGVRPVVGIVGAPQSADEPVEGPEMDEVA